MYSLHRRKCQICGNNDKTLLYRQAFANVEKVSFLKGYDVVVCNECGFAFADNIPSQMDFDIYYEKQSKYEKKLNEISKTRFEMMKNDTKFINKFIKDKNIKILEIGCGSGEFLRYLKEYGLKNLTAIEPSPYCVKQLKGKYGINAIRSSVSRIEVDECFDLIILLTVLEHIVDLENAVAKISQMLCEGGLFFMRIPNACGFADYDDSPFQQFSVEHINYFTKKSAENLLAKYGFRLLAFEEVAMSETDTTVLPMLNLMFGKSNEMNECVIEKDFSALTQLKKYIEKSYKKESEINKRINILELSQELIIVWGIGTHTLRLLELGSLKRCNIIAFIDSNSHYEGGTFNNIPIMLPEALSKYTNKVLISSKVYQNEIVNFIKNELKAPNELILLY